MVKKPFAKFTPSAIIRYFMYLPLNFIPIVGTVLFIILQGKRSGPSAHARYFQLKGMSTRQQEDFVEQRRGAYTRYAYSRKLVSNSITTSELLTTDIALGLLRLFLRSFQLRAYSSHSRTRLELRFGLPTWKVDPPRRQRFESRHRKSLEPRSFMIRIRTGLWTAYLPCNGTSYMRQDPGPEAADWG